jgi:hypothetical protein
VGFRVGPRLFLCQARTAEVCVHEKTDLLRTSKTKKRYKEEYTKLR